MENYRLSTLQLASLSLLYDEQEAMISTAGLLARLRGVESDEGSISSYLPRASLHSHLIPDTKYINTDRKNLKHSMINLEQKGLVGMFRCPAPLRDKDGVIKRIVQRCYFLTPAGREYVESMVESRKEALGLVATEAE